MLVAGSLVGSATALRAGSKCLAIVATRTPPLVPLAVIGVPLAATAAGWLLAGREPPAIARTVIE